LKKKTKVEDLSNKIDEDNTKKEKAEDTKEMIKGVTDKVSNAAGTTTQSSNRKGKREATTKAVDLPDTCSDFKKLYNELLDEAISISDDNIAQIKIYVDALNKFDIDKNCNSTELNKIAEDTAEKAKNALSKTDVYLGEVEARIESNKAEVNKLIEEIENINNELEDRQEATVQIVQSTFFIESTTQGLTEPAGGNNEGSSGPAGGATTQASGGNNEETTKAAEGNNEVSTDGIKEATTTGNNEASTDGNNEATTTGNNEASTDGNNEASTTGNNESSTDGNNEATTTRNNEATTTGNNEVTTTGSNEASTDRNNEATTTGNNEVTTDGNNKATTKSSNDASTEPQTTSKGEMSTAKPQKLLFAVRNRRSRGSMI